MDVPALLKRLVGYGATPHKVVTIPDLVNLVDKSKYDNPRALGLAVVAELERRIGQLDETHQRAFKMLLALDPKSKYYSAPRRRLETLRILGLYMSTDKWRKEHEYEFMTILARQIQGKRGKPQDEGSYSFVLHGNEHAVIRLMPHPDYGVVVEVETKEA